MPAFDPCEPQMITAFQKDGWEVVEKPFRIRMPEKTVLADLKLQRGEQEAIVVEVKCFTHAQDDLINFYVAVGQYSYYLSALAETEANLALYLAIPQIAYDRIIKTSGMNKTLLDLRINLVIVDIDKEEIVEWKT